jgi:MFS family permease
MTGSAQAPGYRWVIVAASAAMLAIAMGMMVNGITAFVIPLSTEFGWPRGAVSLINVAGLIGLALGGVVMGRIADRTTTRSVCLFGSVVFGLSLLGAAWADALWQLYLLFFVAGFLGAGALFAPLIAHVGNWFASGAGLALGIASAGQALGQGGVPFGTAVLISAIGWRSTLTTMGFVALATLIPLALLLRPRPAAEGSASGAGTLPAQEAPPALPPHVITAWLSAAVIFCCTCMAVPLMHLVPLLQDRGFAPEDAGSVIFVMLSVAIVGRIAFGKLADLIGALPAYLIASLWQTMLVFGFTQFGSLDGFYAFAVIYGFGYAGVMTTILVSARTLTPVGKRASSLGIIMVFAWLGHGVGGYQGGYFFDLTGDYTISFGNAALAGVINLVIVGALFLTIRRRQFRLAPASQPETS